MGHEIGESVEACNATKSVARKQPGAPAIGSGSGARPKAWLLVPIQWTAGLRPAGVVRHAKSILPPSTTLVGLTVPATDSLFAPVQPSPTPATSPRTVVQRISASERHGSNRLAGSLPSISISRLPLAVT